MRFKMELVRCFQTLFCVCFKHVETQCPIFLRRGVGAKKASLRPVLLALEVEHKNILNTHVAQNQQTHTQKNKTGPTYLQAAATNDLHLFIQCHLKQRSWNEEQKHSGLSPNRTYLFFELKKQK